MLGNVLHWSAWLWGFMSTVTASGSLLLVMTVLSGRRASADPYEPGEPEPSAAPVEQPYQETQVIDAPLPSAMDGYDFLFTATVWWKPVLDHAGRSDSASPALAAASVVSRAREVVRHEEPGRASFAQYLLDGELGILLPDRNERVKAWAADVTLTLAPADRERLRKLNDLRKDEEVPELFRHLLVPPTGARSEATVGGPPWDGGGPGGEVFDREEEVGVSDRLRLLLTAAGLKPDMDGYTVLVHRVMRSLHTEGLNEAADEIGRAFGLAPDEGPGGEAPDEGNTTGPWPPRSPAPEGPPHTDTAADPHADAFTPWAAEGNASGRSGGQWETGEGDMTSQHFWDPSHSTHRHAEPRTQDEVGN
ncbi:hypothetical protein [Streptomyces anulatus]|uniref:hypothetical protein n=1 Tax=Streptomyces anulatus TaxID=1892 RepID=UPI0027E45B59|nr:hypothetical protein [Streptomyces anulatus]